jgi:hypothetical protein
MAADRGCLGLVTSTARTNVPFLLGDDLGGDLGGDR